MQPAALSTEPMTQKPVRLTILGEYIYVVTTRMRSKLLAMTSKRVADWQGLILGSMIAFLASGSRYLFLSRGSQLATSCSVDMIDHGRSADIRTTIDKRGGCVDVLG